MNNVIIYQIFVIFEFSIIDCTDCKDNIETVFALETNWIINDRLSFSRQINTWALTLANLCRLQGLMVHETKQRVPPSLILKDLVTPHVPEELLVTPEEVKAVLEKHPKLGELPPK